MTRFWLNSVAATIFVVFGTVASTALAHHGNGGPGGHFNGGNSGIGSRQGAFHGPLKNVGPIKVSNPIGGIPHVKPKLPGGPIVTGPIKPPGGPIVGPIGPINPPTGPIKPPTGPVKPPKWPGGGPIVGPIKPPPVGPGGPTGPTGPMGPTGPTQPPGPGTGGGNCGGHHHCKPWWPPIVLGAVPCVVGGGYYGGYYPPVYSQTVVVPAATTTAVEAPQPVVTPVVTPASTEKLPEVPVGSTVTLNAKDLGSTGQVLLVVDKLTIGVHVDEWASDHATATLPQLQISSPLTAEIVLVKADGYAASTVKVQLVAPPAAESNVLGTMASLVR